MPTDLPIAVVGAGFSGTLLAINLLRLGQRVVLIERDPVKLAKGQAFATRRPEHLLNVRAANMSAFPDDADHFVRWMGFSTADQTNRFVPRLAYGQYLLEQLIDALAAAEGRGSVRTNAAVSVDFGQGTATLRLDDGSALACRTVILALGNFPPGPVPALKGLPAGAVVSDPWSGAEAPGPTTDGDHVLLIGTGLTAIDVALSLVGVGFRGRITALSRRGLRPRAHAEIGPVVGSVSRPQAKGSWLIREIRVRATEIGWRAAIDELRPHVQDLWRAHSPAEQDRFLRHARPYWEVHRHRLSPMVDRKIAELETSGRLRFIGGELIGAATRDETSGQGATISYRPRGTAALQALAVNRIINCTGPDGNLQRVPNPLIARLLEAGTVRPDRHRLGLDVDHAGRVRGSDGSAHDRLFAVGPITKGEAWEIVAVPDIRRQVWNLARLLANEHWVGGEGL